MAQYALPDLTFTEFSNTNRRRTHAGRDRSLTDQLGSEYVYDAVADLTRAVNVVRRLEGARAGHQGFTDVARDELITELGRKAADVITGLDIVLGYFNVDLAEAVADRFNQISARRGSDLRVCP